MFCRVQTKLILDHHATRAKTLFCADYGKVKKVKINIKTILCLHCPFLFATLKFKFHLASSYILVLNFSFYYLFIFFLKKQF